MVNRIEVRNLCLSYQGKVALNGINFDLAPKEILAIIGPAQSGKTSILRCLNRTIDFVPGHRMSGAISLNGISQRLKIRPDLVARKIFCFQRLGFLDYWPSHILQARK